MIGQVRGGGLWFSLSCGEDLSVHGEQNGVELCTWVSLNGDVLCPSLCG